MVLLAFKFIKLTLIHKHIERTLLILRILSPHKPCLCPAVSLMSLLATSHKEYCFQNAFNLILQDLERC